MKFLAAFLVFITATYSQAVKADLLLEPVVGYNFNGVFDFEDGERYSGGTGLSYGGRVGYQKLGFQLGLDYLHSSIDADTSDLKEDVVANEFAAFVGFEFPVLLRVYAGYIFAANAESTNADDESVKMSSASGYKVGLGLTTLPFIDINVEYRAGTFDEVKIAGTELDTGVDYQSIMIGLSAPFTF